MNIYRALVTLTTATCLSACGAGNTLWQAEQSCLKYPTPSARASCEAQAKADNVAFRQELEKNKALVQARAARELEAQKAPSATSGTTPDTVPNAANPASPGPAGAAASDASSAPDGSSIDAPKKKSGLCFKREATGEILCPN